MKRKPISVCNKHRRDRRENNNLKKRNKLKQVEILGMENYSSLSKETK